MLYDGYRNKPSTNGTWIYLNDSFPVHQNMIFKANQTIFKADLKAVRLS